MKRQFVFIHTEHIKGTCQQLLQKQEREVSLSCMQAKCVSRSVKLFRKNKAIRIMKFTEYLAAVCDVSMLLYDHKSSSRLYVNPVAKSVYWFTQSSLTPSHLLVRYMVQKDESTSHRGISFTRAVGPVSRWL